MNGRRWLDGSLEMHVLYMKRMGHRPLLDYVSGIEDTLDGSHGPTFTYTPIAYQDDCQIASLAAIELPGNRDEYVVIVCPLRQ